MAIYVSAAGIGYLLGSIPFGLILVRIFRGSDIRTTGSGNIGAANVARVAPGLGVLTLLLDAAKGYGAIYIVGTLATRQGIAPRVRPLEFALISGIAALTSVLGHMFPVWLKFHGGKGVATALGVYLGLMPAAVLIVAVLFVIVVARWSYSSLASITCAAIFPLVAYFAIPRGERWPLLPFVVAISVLVIIRHRQNIHRLLTGTEHRLELKYR